MVGICCSAGDLLVAGCGSAFTFLVLLILGRIKNDNRLLLQSAPPSSSGANLYPALGALGLIAALLACALALTVRRYRRKLARTVRHVERDSLPGLGNADHLLREYGRLVNKKTGCSIR